MRVRLLQLGATIATAMALSGCSSLFESVCLTYGAPSFEVTVRDSVSGATLGAGSRMFWIGSGTDSIIVPSDTSYNSRSIAGPFEQRGIFHVIVRHDGYRDWSTSVGVDGDKCHVRTVDVTARMQRAP